MSTFNGFVSEFPLIRIDHFRSLPGKPAPLACFLSHVHADHLVGLESFKSPFVYCSSATREILLRLEKYPHRMNLTKGILECRIQTYKHLRKLLKPLPLETPIKIELCAGNQIQVTLFDANHCIGSVMFLVEGQGKAILYTGDIRSETWWVNSLARNPILLPYCIGIRRLDKIYLDTTFAIKSEPHRTFPSKAEGIAELLEKVSRYPENTVFYMNAWTFGYEDVWIALSNALQSPLHLDRYRYSIFMSLAKATELGGLQWPQTPSLAGFQLGNSHHPGILTRDSTVRIHSCERGAGCAAAHPSNANVVVITPIVSRHGGMDMLELGAGGGIGDMDQAHELEISDSTAVRHLIRLCQSSLAQSPASARKLTDLLQQMAANGTTRLALDDYVSQPAEMHQSDSVDTISAPLTLDKLPGVIAKLVAAHESRTNLQPPPTTTTSAATPAKTSPLPQSITFPYSRHSSYSELRALVAVFKPRDVWPCTAPPPDAWDEAHGSMGALFGDLCASAPQGPFAHDVAMRQARAGLRGGADPQGRPGLQCTSGDDNDSAGSNEEREDEEYASAVQHLHMSRDIDMDVDADAEVHVVMALPALLAAEPLESGAASSPRGRRALTPTQEARLQARRDAFRAAVTGTWHRIELVSTRRQEVEL